MDSAVMNIVKVRAGKKNTKRRFCYCLTDVVVLLKSNYTQPILVRLWREKALLLGLMKLI